MIDKEKIGCLPAGGKENSRAEGRALQIMQRTRDLLINEPESIALFLAPRILPPRAIFRIFLS
jgi:hypothetical protein